MWLIFSSYLQQLSFSHNDRTVITNYYRNKFLKKQGWLSITKIENSDAGPFDMRLINRKTLYTKVLLVSMHKKKKRQTKVSIDSRHQFLQNLLFKTKSVEKS